MLKTSHVPLTIESDLSFTLIGEEIAEIKNKTIYLTIKNNENYKLNDYYIYGDELRITVEKKDKPTPTHLTNINILSAGQKRYQPQDKRTDQKHINFSPVFDVQILMDTVPITNDKREIRMTLKENTHDGEEKKCSQVVSFTKSQVVDSFEGHFYVPREFTNTFLTFILERTLWESKIIDFNEETIRITDNQFKQTPLSLWDRKKRLIICGILSFLFLLAGTVLGYSLHDTVKSFTSNPQSQSASLPEESADRNINEAQQCLRTAVDRLNSKDLRFKEINEFYDFLIKNEAVMRKCDETEFNNKICGQIRDYHRISEGIKSGNYTEISEAMNDYDNNILHIGSQHAEIVKLILKNDEATFIEKFNDITSFLDIIVNFPEPPTFPCNKCSQIFETQDDLNRHNNKDHSTQQFKCKHCNNTFSDKKSLDNHIQKNHHFTCQICGEDIWFNTRSELENHCKSKHER